MCCVGTLKSYIIFPNAFRWGTAACTQYCVVVKLLHSGCSPMEHCTIDATQNLHRISYAHLPGWERCGSYGAVDVTRGTTVISSLLREKASHRYSTAFAIDIRECSSRCSWRHGRIYTCAPFILWEPRSKEQTSYGVTVSCLRRETAELKSSVKVSTSILCSTRPMEPAGSTSKLMDFRQDDRGSLGDG
jgi:hypothetical protein